MTLRLAPAFATIILATTSAAFAQSSASFSSSPFRFTQQDGEAIYRGVCAGCHMPDGRGATGAGTYPSLVRNGKLEAAGYPVLLVVNGHKAMPAFGSAMTDTQIAAVVNYVRSNFGNTYPDKVSPDDVKAARQ
jgi:mono/diheme cytochrome c family protein